LSSGIRQKDHQRGDQRAGQRGDRVQNGDGRLAGGACRRGGRKRHANRVGGHFAQQTLEIAVGTRQRGVLGDPRDELGMVDGVHRKAERQ
jgi:hypothetical protein